MQNYEVGITGGGNVPNKPESNGENGTISEREKKLVIKQQLIDKISGKAKEIVDTVREITIGEAMGFEKSVPNEDSEMNDVDSEFGLKDPEFYYNQFIEENGGEPLTRSQIKDKMKQIEAELESDNVMTDVEYQELQMQRNVLIDMLHGVTY